MAITTTQTNNVLIKFRTDIYREFRRGNLFSAYMGDGPTSIIQTLFELKDGGDQINIPIVGAMRGPGVSTGPLTGNEEKIDNYGMRAYIDWARNAILLTKAQMRKSSFEQMDVVRPLLTEWGQCLQRDEIVLAMDALPSESPPTNWNNESTAGQRVNGILYDSASPAQLNKWQSDNTDRVVYGSKLSNTVAGNHASSLLAMTAAADKASSSQILLLKRRARAITPQITPYRKSDTKGREYYVAFCGQNAFRDYAADPAIQQANLNARAREDDGMEDNPIFQDGDLLYRGVIIREIPEIDTLAEKTGAGAAGANISPVYLCGQNAVALPWGQMPKPTERREDDYQFVVGRGVEMVYGVAKVFRKIPMETVVSGNRLVQWGQVTGYVVSPPDP
jgi:Protein of unknown function (DUF4043)